MRKMMLLVPAMLLTLAGCASNQYHGTWRGEADGGRGFSFGGLTLGSDGGYTAYANYGGDTKGFTGTYEIEGDTLMLEDSGRSYTLELDDDMLTVTDPTSGHATKLVRVEDD